MKKIEDEFIYQSPVVRLPELSRESDLEFLFINARECRFMQPYKGDSYFYYFPRVVNRSSMDVCKSVFRRNGIGMHYHKSKYLSQYNRTPCLRIPSYKIDAKSDAEQFIKELISAKRHEYDFMDGADSGVALDSSSYAAAVRKSRWFGPIERLRYLFRGR